MSAKDLQGPKCTCGSSLNSKNGCLTCGSAGRDQAEYGGNYSPVGASSAYGTTNRGQTKFDLGSKQDKYLHFQDIDHSHVHVDDEGNKSIKRYGENYPESK